MVKGPHLGHGGRRTRMTVEEMWLRKQKDESQRWTKTKSLYLEFRSLIQQRFRTTGYVPSWGSSQAGVGTPTRHQNDEGRLQRGTQRWGTSVQVAVREGAVLEAGDR